MRKLYGPDHPSPGLAIREPLEPQQGSANLTPSLPRKYLDVEPLQPSVAATTTSSRLQVVV